MRAISLWQPWASLVVAGIKTVETRHWPTSLRGRILIHAAKKYDEPMLSECLRSRGFWSGFQALDPSKNAFEIYRGLPYGAIVGYVDIETCRPSNQFQMEKFNVKVLKGFNPACVYTELDLGNFDEGRFGWVLEHPKMFEKPIPYKGSQGFFNVPDTLVAGLV